MAMEGRQELGRKRDIAMRGGRIHRLAKRSSSRRRRHKGRISLPSRCDTLSRDTRIPARNIPLHFSFHECIFPYTRISLYTNTNLDFRPSPLRICRVGVVIVLQPGYNGFRDAYTVPYHAESRANVIIFRNLLSRCSHCARLLPWQEFVFLAPFPFSSFPPTFSLSSSPRLAVSTRIFFFLSFFLFSPPLFTCAHVVVVVVVVVVHELAFIREYTHQPSPTVSHDTPPFLDDG